LLGNSTQNNFRSLWKNIPPPIAIVAKNYGDLIDRLAINLNMLEQDFCNTFSANNMRFEYSQRYVTE